MTIQEAFTLALARHQSGDFPEAEKLYRQILAVQPNNADCLTLLGVIAHQTGQHATAIELISKAIALDPNAARHHQHLGLALHGAGRFDDAIGAYRRALELNPNSAEAHSNLGQSLVKSGRAAEALVAFRQAVAINPNLPDAQNNLGSALAAGGKGEEAIRHFGTAIRLSPRHADALSNLALALCREGDPDAAVTCCQSALAIRPNHVDARNHLGIALRTQGKLDDAIALFETILAANPNHPDTLNNLGNAFMARRDLPQAEKYFRAALAARPDHASSHWNLGLLLLTQGDYERGLPLYEWRRKVPGLGASGRLPGIEWDGCDLAGRRILVHAEQGFGDCLQCARYIPLLAQRGAKIVLAIPAELTRLLKCLPNVEHLMTLNDSLPAFDLHCPIMSLPSLFKTTLSTIPRTIPYLKADPELKTRWQSRLPRDGRLKVGIAWLGRKKPDPHRTIPPAELSVLSKLEGIWFCSLQKPPSEPPPGLPLTDFGSEIADFADTAALMENLDLIMSIDTSVAHLAGALGRPTWVLLKDVPDWRWLLDRPDSPWYPTMRLFRQPAPGDWKTPIAQIANELSRR